MRSRDKYIDPTAADRPRRSAKQIKAPLRSPPGLRFKDRYGRRADRLGMARAPARAQEVLIDRRWLSKFTRAQAPTPRPLSTLPFHRHAAAAAITCAGAAATHAVTHPNCRRTDLRVTWCGNRELARIDRFEVHDGLHRREEYGHYHDAETRRARVSIETGLRELRGERDVMPRLSCADHVAAASRSGLAECRGAARQ